MCKPNVGQTAKKCKLFSGRGRDVSKNQEDKATGDSLMKTTGLAEKTLIT